MAIPIYNPQVAPPHKPSRRGIAGAEARAAGQLAGGVEQIGTAFAGRLFELANRNQANDAANKARDQWRTFWSDLQRDPEYADYGQKLDIFCSGLREELGKGIKFPGAKREIERQLGDLRQGWADSVQKLSDTRAIDHARTLSVQSINQAIQDRDIPRLRALLAEAGQTMQFEASDLAKLEDTAFREVIRDQTMDHARRLGEEGTAWLASDEAQEKFALQLGPQKRYSLDADTRQQMIKELDAEGRIVDDGFDRDLEDLNIKINSTQGALDALGALAPMPFRNGLKKRQWQDYFEDKQEAMERREKTPGRTVKEIEDRNFGALELQIEIGKLDKLTKQDLLKLVIASTKKYTMDPGKVADLIKYIDGEDPVGLDAARDYLKAKKLGAEAMRRIGVQLEEWARTEAGRDASSKDYQDFIDNKVKPETFKALNKFWEGVKTEVFPDRANLSRAEEWTRFIQEGKVTGLIEEMQPQLDTYNAFMWRLARQTYPQRNIVAAESDTSGEITGYRGAAILYDKDYNRYFLKLVGKELELWGYLKTATRAEQKEGQPLVGGKYEWRLIGKPSKSSELADTIRRQEEAAARKVQREEEAKAIKMGPVLGKTLEEEARQQYNWGNR